MIDKKLLKLKKLWMLVENVISTEKDLVDLCDYDFEIKPWGPTEDLKLNKTVVKVLQTAKKDLPKGYNFIIKDGYRSYEDQLNLVKSEEKRLKKSNPDNWEEMLNTYTGGYEDLERSKEEGISPMNHQSGLTVDISIVDENSDEIDKVGSEYSEKDSLDYYEDKKNLSEKDMEIKKNRKMLRDIMKKHGFDFYEKEWWHWGYKEL